MGAAEPEVRGYPLRAEELIDVEGDDLVVPFLVSFFGDLGLFQFDSPPPRWSGSCGISSTMPYMLGNVNPKKSLDIGGEGL